MPTVKKYSLDGQVTGDLELSDEVFGMEDRSYLYGDVVRAQLLSRRKGSASTLDRGEEKGSTKKLFRQKGTGRARRGNAKSPLLRHGGVAFGPKPKDWSVKIPKKVKRLALKSALSGRVREDGLFVLENAAMENPSTKVIAGFLQATGDQSALIVDTGNRALSLSCRNLPRAKYIDAAGLNLFDVLKYNRVFLTPEAVEIIERNLKS